MKRLRRPRGAGPPLPGAEATAERCANPRRMLRHRSAPRRADRVGVARRERRMRFRFSCVAVESVARLRGVVVLTKNTVGFTTTPLQLLERAASSSTREPISSLPYACPRCVSTVFAVTNSACAISRFVRPATASSTIRRSLGVSDATPFNSLRRGRAPAASNSCQACSASRVEVHWVASSYPRPSCSPRSGCCLRASQFPAPQAPGHVRARRRCVTARPPPL